MTESERPRKYWSDLKKKLTEEAGNSQLSEKIGQLKLQAADGKKYLTDVADIERFAFDKFSHFVRYTRKINIRDSS